MEKGPKEHHVAHPLKRRREISQDSTPNTAGMPDSLKFVRCPYFFFSTYHFNMFFASNLIRPTAPTIY